MSYPDPLAPAPLAPAPPLAPASAPYFTDTDISSSSSTTSLLMRGVLIVLLLALVGFNVFTYLDEITAWFGDTFGPPFRAVARYMGYAATDTAQTTVDVAAKGTKSAVDIAAGAASSGIGVLQQTIGQRNDSQRNDSQRNDQSQDQSQSQDQIQSQDQSQSQSQNQSQSQTQYPSQKALNQALSHAKKESPQATSSTSKSGYCYIGEDRGFRSCVQVGEEDTCMSGDIFPTQAICINPRLRK